MSRPLFVITVAAPTTAELRRRRDAAAQAGADLVELRLDSVADPDVTAALAGRQTPVIATCRPVWEGGAFTGAESDRRKILESAVQHGTEYVDVEFKASFAAELIASSGGHRGCSRRTTSKECRRISSSGCARCAAPARTS